MRRIGMDGSMDVWIRNDFFEQDANDIFFLFDL